MLRSIAILFLLASSSLHAVERKLITDVNVTDLTIETQVASNDVDSFDVVWWIPTEFWEASMRQNPTVAPAQADMILGILKRYAVVGVVQGNISPFGAFTFMDRDTVREGLAVTYVADDGSITPISHRVVDDPDLRLMLDQMKPILAAAMGNMGESFFFFPLPDTDDDGNRLVSPYEKGVLQFQIAAREGQPSRTFEITLPVDSLFEPRICPNGKPAHVSWNYCPWNGEKLD